MDISFESAGAEKDYNDFQRLKRLHNLARAKLIRRRLDDLRAAPVLEVMRKLPGRCHELKSNRVNQLSIDLDGPYRLIFRPTHNPVPRKADSGLDWNKVTAITIMEVVDTHD